MVYSGSYFGKASNPTSLLPHPHRCTPVKVQINSPSDDCFVGQILTSQRPGPTRVSMQAIVNWPAIVWPLRVSACGTPQFCTPRREPLGCLKKMLALSRTAADSKRTEMNGRFEPCEYVTLMF